MVLMNFFGKSPGHPLVSAREAKRVFAELATRDPQSAIEEAAVWLESLNSADGLKLSVHVERLLQLDEAMAAQARRCTREFLARSGGNRLQERQLWQLNYDYWTHLAAAYAECLGQARVPGKESDSLQALSALLAVRALHAHAGVLRWQQLRHAPVEAGFWSAIGAIYLTAVAAGQATREVVAYPGLAPSTIEAEYLKMLLFQAASMDKLPPLQIGLTESLIVHFLPNFSLTNEVRPESVYWIDAAKPLPPTRLAKLPEAATSLRFFSGGKARLAVEQLIIRIRADHRVPADINLAGQYEADTVIRALQHLAVCWAPKPPLRGHARHRLQSRLVVGHGLIQALEHLSQRATGIAELEFWTVDDVSIGGVGALAELGHKDWIRVGSLLFFQPEQGGNWLLGVVRRFARRNSKQGAVGIETLSKNPRAVSADAGGLPTEAILLDLPEVGEYARMVLAPGTLPEKAALLFPLDGMRARLHPREVLEESADYIIASFFVQSFS